MASILQIQANRRNSQKSTGPRSLAGKAVSSMNALKSGIDAKSQVIRGEDSKELELLRASYYDSLQPTRPEEAVFVDAIISADWLLRRLRKTEAETWNDAFQGQEQYEKDEDAPEQEFRMATAFMDRESVFDRLQRRLDATQRSLHRAMDALRRLRQDRPTPDPPPTDPPPLSLTPSPLTTKTKIGFVPPTPPQPVIAPLSGPVFSAPVSASLCLCVKKVSPLSRPPLQ